MKKKSPKRYIRIVLVKSALLGITTWLISGIAMNQLPYSMVIADIFQPATGGLCRYSLYDKSGNGYETIKTEYTGSAPLFNFITSGYVGSAPLYNVNPKTLGLQQDSWGCYDFPSKIDAGIAYNGTPMYPIFFSVKNNSKSKWLRAGESCSLVVTAKVGDYFSSNSVWIPVIPLAPNELIAIRFSIYAPNFEFSPTNQETQIVPMGFDIPAEQTWAIAPNERANGVQSLSVTIESDNIQAQAAVNLDVRNVFGTEPKSLSAIIAIGSGIAFLLTQTKPFTDLLQTLRKKAKLQKKRRNE